MNKKRNSEFKFYFCFGNFKVVGSVNLKIKKNACLVAKMKITVFYV